MVTIRYKARKIDSHALGDLYPPSGPMLRECSLEQIAGDIGAAFCIFAQLLGYRNLKIHFNVDDDGMVCSIQERITLGRVLRMLYFLPLDLLRGHAPGRFPIGSSHSINDLIWASVVTACDAYRVGRSVADIISDHT